MFRKKLFFKWHSKWLPIVDRVVLKPWKIVAKKKSTLDYLARAPGEHINVLARAYHVSGTFLSRACFESKVESWDWIELSIILITHSAVSPCQYFLPSSAWNLDCNCSHVFGRRAVLLLRNFIPVWRAVWATRQNTEGKGGGGLGSVQWLKTNHQGH